MLQTWERQNPGRLESIFRAVTDVVPSHLLDRKLFDFDGLTSEQGAQQLEVVQI